MKVYPIYLAMATSLLFFSCKKSGNIPAPAVLNSIQSTGTLCKGLSICFSAIDTGATSYLWSFGDGSTSTDVAPCHIYSDTGLVTARLTINNDTSLSKTLQLHLLDQPPYTFSVLNGMKVWRYYRESIDNGATHPMQIDSFPITYVDPGTIIVNGLTFNFIYVHDYGTYTLYRFYTRFNNSGGGPPVADETIDLIHTPTTDSIHYYYFFATSLSYGINKDYYAP